VGHSTKINYPRKGSLIFHDRFGRGKVLNTRRDSSGYIVIVNFGGEKKMLLWEYAREHITLLSTQEILLELIKENSGLDQQKISKEMGITESGVGWILKILKSLGLVETRKVGRRVNVYPKWQAPKVILTEPQKIIVKLVKEKPGLIKKEITKITGLTQTPIWKNIEILKLRGLIETRRVGGEVRVYLKGQAPEVIFTSTQEKIFEVIREMPGLTQTEIAKKIDIPKDTVGWNIKTLRSRNLIKTIKIGSIVKVFPAGELPLESILTRVQEKIFNVIKEKPGLTRIEIAKKLNLCKDVIGDNIKKLVGKDLVVVKKVGKTIQVYPTAKAPEGIILSLNREKILNNVRESPGLTQTEIQKKTNILLVTVNANVGALESLGLVETKKVGGKVKVYPKGQAPKVVFTQNEEAILKLVKIRPGLIQKQIAKRIKIDESSLSKNIRQPESRGLIRRKRKRSIKIYPSKNFTYL